MSAITVMLMVLALLMLVVGGKKGLMALLSVVGNLIVLVVMIWMLVKGVPFFLVSLIFIVLTLLINFFLCNEEVDAYHTKVGFIASASLIGLMSLVLPLVSRYFYSYGFAGEELEELGNLSFDLTIHYQTVFSTLVIVAMIGAVIDGAIAVSSAMHEVSKAQPNLSAKELRQSGLSMGHDIISTTMTTLLLAFFGNYLGIILYVMDFNYGLSYLFNAQLVVAQLVVMLLSAMGTLLILPWTAFCYVWLKNEEEKE